MSSPNDETTSRRFPLRYALAIAVAVVACMIYANLSFAVTDSRTYRYFPPFQAGTNRNMNWELGHEYFNIARSLAAGEGFSHPFPGKTGPTAWMPPILPMIVGSLWWLCDGNQLVVMIIVLVVQGAVLITTGWLTLAIAQRTTQRIGPTAITAIYVFGMLLNFRDCFQANGDRWITLLTVDLLLAGFVWGRPLDNGTRALSWGLFGGVCGLITPIAVFTWGVLSLYLGVRDRAWTRTMLMLLAAALAMSPWMIRNYLVFGRLIPVKSNLAYELYQSHCLQSDGILQGRTIGLHPYQRSSRERQVYDTLGETGFLDRKSEQFRAAVAADPWDLIDRIAARFLGATVWYVPMDRSPNDGGSWWFWVQRVTHPVPFLCLFVLVLIGVADRLHPTIWIAIAIYLLYLMPYIITSYYARYAFPLLAVKVLFIVWALDWFASWRAKASAGSSEPEA